MDITKQVVSLELARKLKTLGVKQESLFYWKHKAKHEHGDTFTIKPTNGELIANIEQGYSAFTVAELGSLLPYCIEIDGECYFLNWFMDELIRDRRKVTVHHLQYETTDNEVLDGSGKLADTEADARAKMLIYLLENHLTQPL